jgi:hypothetical protein
METQLGSEVSRLVNPDVAELVLDAAEKPFTVALHRRVQSRRHGRLRWARPKLPGSKA